MVLTGGEPLLQVDEALTAALRERGFEVAIETNGTIEAAPGLDWICVSPKAGAPLKQRKGDELKLVCPQVALQPDEVADLDFDHCWLQPMDRLRQAENTAAAAAYCLQKPKWRLGLQTRKLIGIQ